MDYAELLNSILEKTEAIKSTNPGLTSQELDILLQKILTEEEKILYNALRKEPLAEEAIHDQDVAMDRELIQAEAKKVRTLTRKIKASLNPYQISTWEELIEILSDALIRANLSRNVFERADSK